MKGVLRSFRGISGAQNRFSEAYMGFSKYLKEFQEILVAWDFSVIQEYLSGYRRSQGVSRGDPWVFQRIVKDLSEIQSCSR